MKKFLAFLLAAMMLLSSAALAEYDTHLTLQVTNRGQLSAGVGYTEDDYYKWMSEKWNIDIEPWITDSATHAETCSMWINTGDMPDILTLTSFNYGTYREWVDQGLLAPLPDGWETTYPNLYKTLKQSMILDYLTVDGKVYGLPGTTYCNYVPMEIPVGHSAVYYRKDWATQLGYEFGDVVTLDELKKFCLECIEKDMAGNGSTIGLTTTASSFVGNVMYMSGHDFDGFVKTETGYVWAPTIDGTTEQIAVLRDLYTTGMLDADFYLLDGTGCKNRFSSGVAAAMYGDGGPGNMTEAFNGFEEANPEMDADECIGVTVLADNNGQNWAAEASNFWTIKYMNPNIDPAVQARILDMIEYFCTPEEGQIALAKGIPGVDWKWTEDGLVDTTIRDPEKPSYQSTKLVAIWGLCNDELYSIYTTNTQPGAVAEYQHNMAVKAAGNIIRKDYDYAYYQSDLKAVYSIDITSKIAGLVADSTLDIETEWAKFITENEPMWKPLEDELNAQLFTK